MIVTDAVELLLKHGIHSEIAEKICSGGIALLGVPEKLRQGLLALLLGLRLAGGLLMG